MCSLVAEKYYSLTNNLISTLPVDTIRHIISYDSLDAHKRASVLHNKNICESIRDMGLKHKLKVNLNYIDKKLQQFFNYTPSEFVEISASISNNYEKSFTLHMNELPYADLLDDFTDWKKYIMKLKKENYPDIKNFYFSHYCCSNKGIVFLQHQTITNVFQTWDKNLNSLIDRINNEEDG